MSEILEQLPLDQQIKKALLGEDCPLHTVYDLIVAYEKGEWAEFSGLAAELGIAEDEVPGIIQDALHRADAVLSML